MINNAAVYQKPEYAHDSELALYAKRELLGSPAVLVGAHEANSHRQMRTRRSVGRARRAGVWVSHHLAALMVLTGGRA